MSDWEPRSWRKGFSITGGKRECVWAVIENEDLHWTWRVFGYVGEQQGTAPSRKVAESNIEMWVEHARQRWAERAYVRELEETLEEEKDMRISRSPDGTCFSWQDLAEVWRTEALASRAKIEELETAARAVVADHDSNLAQPHDCAGSNEINAMYARVECLRALLKEKP